MLSVASEFLALGAEVLSTVFGAGFVGSVILGFITMLPELIFVLVAITEGEVEVAVGSAVEGNILLFTLGYGLVVLIAYLKHGEIITLPPTMKDDLWYLIISALYLLMASIDRKLTLMDGIVLVGLYIVFILHQFWESKNLGLGSENEEPVSRREWIKSASYLIGGGIAVLIAAEPFVHNIIDLSNETGIPAIFLALIISPIASEMPEKISAFVLAKKSMRGAEIAIANFIGSKVQSGTLLFGAMIILHIRLGNEVLDSSNTMFGIFIAVFTTIIG